MSTEHPTPTAGVHALRPVSTTPPRREQPIEKAARLISEERVSLEGTARVYAVTGDSATYRVIATEAGIFCPCDARTGLCAHVLAVALVRQRGKPNPERLVKDLGVER